jgi:hypothetical protein
MRASPVPAIGILMLGHKPGIRIVDADERKGMDGRDKPGHDDR